MQQGPGDLWLLGAPPADSATPQLTLAADGTPDDAAHPNSIHLGGLAEGTTIAASAKVDFQRIDQFPGPVSAVFTEEILKLEAIMAEAQDLAKVRHILSHGAYGTFTDPTNGKQITVGGWQPLFVFAGTGLNDATRGGRYTGTAVAVFEVAIDASVPSPDTFKWRKDAGSWTEGVAITGAAQTLSDGVTVLFGAINGHTIADQWTITAIPLEPCIAAIAPTKADATKFIVCVIFRARSQPSLSLGMARSKAMVCKLSFEAQLDPARVAGRQSGVLYVTQ